METTTTDIILTWTTDPSIVHPDFETVRLITAAELRGGDRIHLSGSGYAMVMHVDYVRDLEPGRVGVVFDDSPDSFDGVDVPADLPVVVVTGRVRYR